MASNSRVWFITGTSSGIGKALVEVILAANERVVATLRKPETLASLQSKYPAAQLLVVPLDVADQTQIAAAFEAARRKFGRIDVVVNNAGYAVMGEIEAIPEEDARKQFEVQFWGPVNITKQAINFFRNINPPAHGGRILNISTIGGYSAKQPISKGGFSSGAYRLTYSGSKTTFTDECLAYYSSSKFALEGFTEAFIKEMPPAWNIKGCIIELGGVETEWRNSSMVTYPQPSAYADSSTPTSLFRSMHAAVEMIGSTEKMGRAIMKIADIPSPPLRIQLGSEANALIVAKAKETIRDAEAWAEIAHSTNRDDVDVAEYMKTITVAFT